MNRDQEKAMFASQGKSGPGIRKKQIDNQKPKLRFKSSGMNGNRESGIKIRGNQIFHTDENGKWNISHHESQYCPDCRKAGRSKNTGYPIDPIASGEADEWYKEYAYLQKRTKLEPLTFHDYYNAKQYWDNLSEEKRRNVLSTVTGKSTNKIKFVNYRFNDLSHREQNACLILSNGYNYLPST